MASKKDNLTYKQKIDLIRNGNYWCTKTFFIGLIKKIFGIIFSKEFLVFSIYTIIMILSNGFANELSLIVYTIISCVFIMTESVKILIEQNTKMNLELRNK